MITAAATSGERARPSPAEICLRPLLNALDWPGDVRHLSDALPDERTIANFTALAAVLDRLSFGLTEIKAGAQALDEDSLPALLVAPDGDVWVILHKADLGLFQVFQGRKAMPAIVEQSKIKGRIFHVRAKETDRPGADVRAPRGLGHFWDREGRLIRLLFVITFCINSLALALPVYLMAVYDFAIGNHSTVTLATLLVMIVIILAAEMGLRDLRARAIARLAVRMQMLVVTTVFERLMRLPVSYIENASVAGQLNRLRGFESVRDIFSGPLAAALLDLPFIVFFVALVFAIGGVLGWFLVAFIGIMAGLGIVFVPRARLRSHRAGAMRSSTRNFRSDLTRHLATVRDSGAQHIWARRYRELIGRQLGTALAAQDVTFAEQTLAQGFSSMTGGLIIGFGALEVIHGTLPIGALAAVMAIVWRVLSPIQTAYLNVTRMFRAIDTAKQLSQLMKLPLESGGYLRSASPQFRGEITLENVGLRQGALALPVLRGINLTVKAGEFIVLAGAPGPSRSALLKLIANLHQPSFGRICIDGCDVRQFDVRELRRCAALVSDEQILFSGTLAHNLLLANPLADEMQLHAALAEANLLDYVEELPQGLHTDLTEMLRTGLSATVVQKIKLARSYILSPSIYLLDEPAKDLDQYGQEALVRKLKLLKGKATILVRTSHEEIVKLADRVVRLSAGLLEVVPPPAGAPQPRPPLLNVSASAPKGRASR